MVGSDRVPLHPSRNTLHLHDRTARSCHLSLGRVQACAPWIGDSWPVFEMPGHCHVSVRKSLKHRGWALVWAIGSSRPPAPTCVAFGHKAVWDRQFILEPGSRERGEGWVGMWSTALLPDPDPHQQPQVSAASHRRSISPRETCEPPADRQGRVQ